MHESDGAIGEMGPTKRGHSGAFSEGLERPATKLPFQAIDVGRVAHFTSDPEDSALSGSATRRVMRTFGSTQEPGTTKIPRGDGCPRSVSAVIAKVCYSAGRSKLALRRGRRRGEISAGQKIDYINDRSGGKNEEQG